MGYYIRSTQIVEKNEKTIQRERLWCTDCTNISYKVVTQQHGIYLNMIHKFQSKESLIENAAS